MGWNGDGTFSREHNWQDDADNDIDIVPDRHDDEDDNLATGIQACLAKNGENTPSADLPMGNNKHTGVGDADARTQYAKVSQVQDGAYSYAADTGAADAYVMTLVPAITAYATGAEYRFLAANANTGASTLNINGVGATAIRKNGTAALVADDIKAGEVFSVVYDGTFFQMKSSRNLESDATAQDYGGTARRVGWVPGTETETASRDLDSGDINNTIFIDASVTLTIPSGVGSAGHLISVLVGNATLSLALGSGMSLFWYQGGSQGSGARTVATFSAITLYKFSSTAWIVYGNGIS